MAIDGDFNTRLGECQQAGGEYYKKTKAREERDQFAEVNARYDIDHGLVPQMSDKSYWKVMLVALVAIVALGAACYGVSVAGPAIINAINSVPGLMLCLRILVAGGVLYGFWKWRQSKEKKVEQVVPRPLSRKTERLVETVQQTGSLNLQQMIVQDAIERKQAEQSKPRRVETPLVRDPVPGFPSGSPFSGDPWAAY